VSAFPKPCTKPLYYATRPFCGVLGCTGTNTGGPVSAPRAAVPVKSSFSQRLEMCDNEKHSISKCNKAARGEDGQKGVSVSDQAETPFDSIEGSHEYVAMLAEAIDEARRDVEGEIAAAERERADRRKEALLLVSYNLAKLNLHITAGRRILNDLRSLRRLLLAERGVPAAETEEVTRDFA